MSLLSQLLGNEDLSNIDQKINNIISKIDNSNTNVEKKESKSLEDLTGDFLGLVDDAESSNPANNEFEKLFKDINIPNERLARYATYDEIYNSVSLTKRVIGVYVSNILSKNPVNNKTLIYRENSDNENVDESKTKESKKICKDIVKKFDILEKLKKAILPNRLKYGDYFVEVVNVDQSAENIDWDKFTNNHYNVVTECENIIEETKKTKDYDSYLMKAANFLFEYTEKDLGVDNEFIIQESADVEENKNYNLSNVLLKYHKPHNIIILETKYGTRIGYLEVEKNANSSASHSISSMVQRITTMGSKNGPTQEENTNKLIRYVVSKIISNKTNKKINDKNVKSILHSLDPSVFTHIKRLVIEQGYDKKNKQYMSVSPIQVRFIPSNKIVHFSNPGSSNYEPFSNSIIDPLVLPGKLYMLTQLSNIITKLSRASLIRKWTIDTGPTKMTGNTLQKLKREIYNTRVTLNDLGSFKSMSKILSDFRDVFAVSHNGRTPVDFEIQQTGDANIKTEDLKDLRQELISLTGIPSTYLGMQDTVQLSDQLSNINQTFAVEISDQQQNDIECINLLIKKISMEAGINYDVTKYVTVSLTPPVVLIIQLIESTLNSIGNIAGIFTNLQIPVDPYYLLEQYVPQIDWRTFKEKASKYEKNKIVKNNDENQSGGRW